MFFFLNLTWLWGSRCSPKCTVFPVFTDFIPLSVIFDPVAIISFAVLLILINISRGNAPKPRNCLISPCSKTMKWAPCDSPTKEGLSSGDKLVGLNQPPNHLFFPLQDFVSLRTLRGGRSFSPAEKDGQRHAPTAPSQPLRTSTTGCCATSAKASPRRSCCRTISKCGPTRPGACETQAAGQPKLFSMGLWWWNNQNYLGIEHCTCVLMCVVCLCPCMSTMS